jgi:hypothetical protein
VGSLVRAELKRALACHGVLSSNWALPPGMCFFLKGTAAGAAALVASAHPASAQQIGTTIKNPNIDYSALARSMGVHGEGPITDPKDLAPALKRALDVVARGEPALVDVVTQPR